MQLINGTQHKQDQDQDQWSSLGISYLNNEVPYSNVPEDASIRKEIKKAWQNLLSLMDNQQAKGEQWNGVLLGGYAPITIALYQFLSNFRQHVCVAVMAPTPVVEGQRRSFTPVGVRFILPPKVSVLADPNDVLVEEGQPLSGEMLPLRRASNEKFVLIGNRALTPSRKEILENLGSRNIIEAPLANPPMDGFANLEDFYGNVLEVLKLAHAHSSPILFDGAPTETTLRIAQGCFSLNIPMYYIRHRFNPSHPPTPISIEKIPQF